MMSEMLLRNMLISITLYLKKTESGTVLIFYFEVIFHFSFFSPHWYYNDTQFEKVKQEGDISVIKPKKFERSPQLLHFLRILQEIWEKNPIPELKKMNKKLWSLSRVGKIIPTQV